MELLCENFNDTLIKYNKFIFDNGIELWKTIKDFDRYEISNMGRVRVRESGRVNGGNKMLKPNIRGGYCQVTLKNKINRKTFRVHIIVAKHFIINSNPNEFGIVDHIDGNKSNNAFINLRWTSHSGNIKNFYDNYYLYKGKPIIQYDLNGTVIKEWKNIREILEIHKNYNYFSLLKCLTGKFDKVYNFNWKYKESDKEKLEADEIFKNIGIYEDHDFSGYEVSNYGKIMNVSNQKFFKTEKNLNEYISAYLTDKKTKKATYIKIHRLVATYFVNGKTNEKNIVNHKDENKGNNHYKNLEWMTNQENVEYSCGKKVKQLDKKTNNIIRTFVSIQQACKFHNYGKNSHVTISKCCRGILKTAYNFRWEYA